MARGAISPMKATISIFTAAQFSIWFAILSQVSTRCVFWAVPQLLLVGFYPYAKRITSHPQTLLGVTLSWGMLTGSVAMGIDPTSLGHGETLNILSPLACLIASYIVWTMMIDMIYANLDLRDDLKAGIHSVAVKYRRVQKLVLSILGSAQISLLCASNYLMGSGSEILTATSLGSGSLILWMVWNIDPKNPASCSWWFQNAALMMGSLICASLSAEYTRRLNDWYRYYNIIVRSWQKHNYWRDSPERVAFWQFITRCVLFMWTLTLGILIALLRYHFLGRISAILRYETGSYLILHIAFKVGLYAGIAACACMITYRICRLTLVASYNVP